MMGGNVSLDLRVMPSVVFTDPRVATGGLTAEAARAHGLFMDTRMLALEKRAARSPTSTPKASSGW
jgi:mercuric reductase